MRDVSTIVPEGVANDRAQFTETLRHTDGRVAAYASARVAYLESARALQELHDRANRRGAALNAAETDAALDLTEWTVPAPEPITLADYRQYDGAA